jgi:rhamnogalacturonyl hydrolase YesR
LKQAADQCKKYKEVLATDQGPWRHISGPERPWEESWGGKTTDARMWSSGNGWATAGMSRVIATMRNSGFDAETKAEQGMLTDLIKKIVDGARALDTERQDQTGLLRNYLDSSFPEIAGTALIAASTLRMAVLEP